jgi:transposase-like protein
MTKASNPPRRRFTTQAQRDAIEQLRGTEGWTVKRIAKHLGLSRGAVDYWCLVLGVERAGAPIPSTPPRPAVVQRGSHVVRVFTPAEDAALQAMAEARVCDIARRLGRRSNSIIGRRLILARRAERAILIAEREATQ